MPTAPTPYNKSMSTEYYEDIKLHQKYRSREYRLTEKEIIDYAQKWDPQPFHIDPEFAKNTKFGGLVASGSHLLAICLKMEGEKRPRRAWIAAMGLDKIGFLTPARPGDILVFENELISKRESKSDSNAGIVHFAAKLLNQLDEPVLTYEVTALVEKRPAKGIHTSESGAR